MENCKPTDVLVDGEYLLQDGILKRQDEHAIYKVSQKQSADLWKRI